MHAVTSYCSLQNLMLSLKQPSHMEVFTLSAYYSSARGRNVDCPRLFGFLDVLTGHSPLDRLVET